MVQKIKAQNIKAQIKSGSTTKISSENSSESSFMSTMSNQTEQSRDFLLSVKAKNPPADSTL